MFNFWPFKQQPASASTTPTVHLTPTESVVVAAVIPVPVVTPVAEPVVESAPQINPSLANNTPGFNFAFTSCQVAKMLPTNRAAVDWYAHLLTELPKYEINTLERVAAFISQCAHESSDFTRLHENLNYRAASLIATWPKRFNSENAPRYEHKPEKIANCVYSNRMGNGDEASGDGYKFRGRGPIQITGKDNYAACSRAVFKTDVLLNNPDLVEKDMDTAIDSALWYWSSNNLNQYADKGDVTTITKKINGGLIGLDDRTARYTSAVKILSGK